ncbi:MAG: polysaccharide deacetylase family protein [Gemmatimonadaceae bacterium]
MTPLDVTGFMHHGIASDERIVDGDSYNSPSAGLLRGQLSYLRRRFRFVTIDELADRARNDVALPERSAILTFDDGFRSVLTRAAPVLDELRIPAVVFVVTGTLDRSHMPWFVPFNRFLRLFGPRPLTWHGVTYDLERFAAQNAFGSAFKTEGIYPLPGPLHRPVLEQLGEELGLSPNTIDECFAHNAGDGFDFLSPHELRECEAAGIAVGSHSHTHASMAALSGLDLETEILHSQSRLRDLGVRARAFSYPDGRSGSEARALVRQTYDIGFGVAVPDAAWDNLPRVDLWRRSPRELWHSLGSPPRLVAWLETKAMAIASRCGLRIHAWG